MFRKLRKKCYFFSWPLLMNLSKIVFYEFFIFCPNCQIGISIKEEEPISHITDFLGPVSHITISTSVRGLIKATGCQNAKVEKYIKLERIWWPYWKIIIRSKNLYQPKINKASKWVSLTKCFLVSLRLFAQIHMSSSLSHPCFHPGHHTAILYSVTIKNVYVLFLRTTDVYFTLWSTQDG